MKLVESHPELFKQWPEFHSEKSKRRWLTGWEKKQASMFQQGYVYKEGKWVRLSRKKRRRLNK